jgi:hypothetical protein
MATVVASVLELMTTLTRVGAAIFAGMVAAMMSMDALAGDAPLMFLDWERNE